DVEKILYQPFNLVVLQDFEALTPHILALVSENVKGGGILIFLLHNVKNVEDISSSKMFQDINTHQEISRFNKRFISSLSSLSHCLILDDNLNILSPASKSIELPEDTVRNSNKKEAIQELKVTHQSDAILSALLSHCQTADQAKLVITFMDILQKRAFHANISVSSPKGRGKSAALGLAIAGSLALNYSNIFISSLHYDNVKIIFRFLFKGLDALNYKEDEDYDLIESVNPQFNKALIGINVFRDHPQGVRFILPGDVDQKLEQAELIVIDEVAAIPLPLLKTLTGSHIVLMASTTSGCGATGRCLYNKVVNNFHQLPSGNEIKSDGLAVSPLKTVQLSEPAHYAPGDAIESWLNRVFCLEPVITTHLSFGCPEPQKCQLYYVCRETLFSGHNNAENFLESLTSILSSSKRVISPNYLLQLADNPDYHIFCLLPPLSNSKKASPEILCAILVHIEKEIPANIIHSGCKQDGIMSQCFSQWKTEEIENASGFLPIQGIHILDLVTHPDFQRMGYGLRAFQLLQEFYSGLWVSVDENPSFEMDMDDAGNSSEALPPLLLQLTEVQPQKIEFFFISYNLSSDLLRFWKKAGFVPVFISKEVNSAKEHSCFMLKCVDKEFENMLQEIWRCFQEYFFVLLSSVCKKFPSSFALSLLHSNVDNKINAKDLTKADIDMYLKPRCMKSLEKYCQNLGDLQCIKPIIPILTKLYFRAHFKNISIPVVQEAILLSFGLQHKTADEISKDLGLPSIQVHGLLNRTIKKLTKHLTDIIEETVEKTIIAPEVKMEPLVQDLDQELEEAAKKIQQQQIEDSKKLKDLDLSQYAIKGSEDDWEKALHTGRKTLVSIKSIKKKPEEVELPKPNHNVSFKGKHKHGKKKR
ncbi:N-acetyltransferase 10, partial [Stegodyphus mimosarum]